MRSMFVCLSILATITFTPVRARAEPQAPASSAAQALPDLVRLKNGGILRGTIVEMQPNNFVVIQLPTGEARRVLMSDVTFAGAAADAPPEAPAQPPQAEAPASPGVIVHGEQVRLKLTAEEPGITFHRVDSMATGIAMGHAGAVGFAAAGFQELCTAPCEVSLPAGSYMMALSQGSGGPVPLSERVTVNGPSTLKGSYTSYRGLRIAGFVTGVVSIGVGLTVMILGVLNRPDCPAGIGCSLDLTPVIAGGVIAGVGVIGGTIVSLKSDSVEIAVAPAAPPPISERTLIETKTPRAGVAGLSLVGHF